MDRTVLFACLALLVVVQVQSYTLQDVLRNRLRQRELSRLRQYDMYDTDRLRQYDMYDADPVYDQEREHALNWLREFHFKRMFDDGKGKPDCVDNRPDCHGAQRNGLCKELQYPPEHQDQHTVNFITKWCAKTCNVNNCNSGAGEIKPTKPPHPVITACKDKEGVPCSGWSDFCKVQGTDDLQRYIFEYCSETCAGMVGTNIVNCHW